TDGDTLTITAVNGTAISEGQTIVASDGVKITLSGGQLVFDATGTVYEAALIGTHNDATYSYTISDGNGGFDTANVDMTFCGVTNTLETIKASLPDSGVVNISLDQTGGEFYNATITQTGDDRFDGKTFDIAFCGNVNLGIQTGQDILVNFYMGDEASAPDSIAHPENLDLVNWILNQDFTSVDNGDGTSTTYTEAEIQGAIWGLTDGFVFVNEAVPAFGTKANAQEIYQQALLNGEGYVPGEGDIVSIIVDPVDGAATSGNEQPFIIGIDFDDLAQDCFCFG
ncbi:thioester domain-containing protein, partial [Tropicimonas sp.]|uniref:thioester domain-containing protein n=1 Tax=Tropicimonas sp. TaxID=2067044 RepID=UPI003A85F19B